MKKIMAVVLAALMLLSCVTIVSADSPKRVMITACDDLAGWSNNDKPFAENNVPEPAMSTDLADYPVVSFTYTGAVHGNGGWGRPAEQISEMQGTKIAYKAETPFDLTGMNYVIFDVYVSNAAALSGVKFYMELTSGGQPDKEEIGFQMTFAEMKGSELVDGWNHIELALAASNTKYGDPINWSAWNFLRIYNGTNYDAGEGLTIAFKNFYFCEVSVAAQQAQAAAQSIIDLYTPIAEISSGDITAENYESVKSQLAAAIAAYNSAEVAIQSAVTEVVDASKIDTPTYLPRPAAKPLEDGSYEYVKLVFNSDDGYYHIGSKNGPLLLADLMGYTEFSEDATIWDLAYDGKIVVGGKDYKEALTE